MEVSFGLGVNLQYSKLHNPADFPEDSHWDILPFLHLGFGLINLIYIPVSIWLAHLLGEFVRDPQISALLIQVYGTDFQFIFQKLGWVKLIGVGLVVYTTYINFRGYYLIKNKGSLTKIRFIAWMNIGVPPWGTLLGIVVLVKLKQWDNQTRDLNETIKNRPPM